MWFLSNMNFLLQGHVLKAPYLNQSLAVSIFFLFFGRFLDLIMNYDEGEYGLVSCYIQVLQQQISLIIAP